METEKLNEEIEELEDEIDDDKEEAVEEQQELMKDLSEEDIEAYGSIESDKEYGLMKFLTEVRDIEDTTRTSYLTKSELGNPLFSVRFWENLKILAIMRKRPILAAFIQQKVLSTTTTGLSREGFLMNTTITRKKEKSRSKVSSPNIHERGELTKK